MIEGAPPVWNHVPEGLPPAALKRYVTIGTTCLALAGLQLLSCVMRLLSPLFGDRILDLQRSFMPGHPVAAVADAGKAYMARIALWESLRTIPFVIATIFLIRIALRIRRGEPEALRTARTWALWGLGVVAISALVQILVTVPETLAYQREILDRMPALPRGVAGPVDVGELTSSITTASTLVGLASGTASAAAWPIALYFWAGTILRETAPPAVRG